MNATRVGNAEAAARSVLHRTCGAEQAVPGIEKAGALLSCLLEHIPAGILVAYGAPDFPIVVVNEMAEALLGCPREHLLSMAAGHHVTQFQFSPLNAPASPRFEALPLYRTAHFGEALRDEEWTVRRRDGSRSVVLVNTNPLRDSSGSIVGAITCLRDISRLKEMEEALRLNEARLRQADQRKDEFLAMLAHELRGPLAPIRNVQELLRLKSDTDPALSRLSAILQRQVRDMGRLLDDVLDLSRQAVGKLRLDLRPVELASVIEHALEWARPLIAARSHHLTLSMPEQAIRVQGDAGRLAQVFSNLFTNAAKYTDPGGSISVNVERAGGSATVSVRDTGRGLDASDMAHLFDLFYQPARTLDRAEGGLGIGLSLVRGLVSMHGGRVEARSAGRGKGSEFLVTLPILAHHAGGGGIG